MKIENIHTFYKLNNDRFLIKRAVEALNKEENDPYVMINTLSDKGLRIPKESAIAIRNILREQLIQIENKIQKL